MAGGLSRQVKKIENAISLLSMLTDRLRYLQPPMRSLIESLASLEQFRDTYYLQQCRRDLRRGLDFPQSWSAAVHDHEREMGTEAAEILRPLGEVLGCTDLDSQLAALAHARHLLENRLDAAREYQKNHAKLYRSLGLLSGIALAIILF